MPAYRLPYGTLSLRIDHADLPPDELFAPGARDNPRRAFLFVSKVLGKHIPVPTETLARVHRLLAAKLPADLPAPVLFIGMTETATALAQGVFEAWLAAHPATPATSRLRVKGADICPFAESHSHAAQQWLHLPAERGLLNAAQSLVLIDDELSTGNTFRVLASALRPQLPALRTTHWLSLTDFSPPAAARDVQRHSLLRGRWHYEATAAVPPVASVQEVPITIADSGFGRLGVHQAVQLDSAAWTKTGDIRGGARVLVLGSGEFIHPPAVFARALAARSGAEVYLQSSSRSPALVWGALQRKRRFADPYDADVPYYLYNLADPRAYGHIFICHEHPANAALRETAATLDARLLHLRAKRCYY